MKIKIITYERLLTDRKNYHNTRIGCTAEIEETENPSIALNTLKDFVNNKLKTYQELYEEKESLLITLNTKNMLLRRMDMLSEGDYKDRQKEELNETEKKIKTLQVRIAFLEEKSRGGEY